MNDFDENVVTVEYREIQNGLAAVVTLNRPEARNAISPDLGAALPSRVREANDREGVRAIILTGADPAFCAGFDVRDVASGKKKGENPHPGYWGALPPTRVPIIGAINGAAVTGGFEIALACDFLIASDKAKFADTHARVGMAPGWGLTIALPRVIGLARARRMSITAEFVDAKRALEWGLVTEVVPHEQLIDRALHIAEMIAANHEGAVSEIRSIYNDVAELGDSDAAYEFENRRAREWAKQRFAPKPGTRSHDGGA